MVELVYTWVSKTHERKLLRVRLPPQALMTPQRIINKIKDNTPLKTIKETQKETRKTMVTLIVSSFGLVTALAWNDAIQSFFNLVFPKSGGLVGKFIYAIFITIIVVNLSSHLKTFFDPEEPDKQKKPQQ